ncbi:MAG: PP2C family protein-serine/threonine phosphatase [Terriglobales bacterium]
MSTLAPPQAAPRFERRLFDLIEAVSRGEREARTGGTFSRALAEQLVAAFGPELQIIAAADLKPKGGRYEPAFTVEAGGGPGGADWWAAADGALATRTLQRRLAGQLWWIRRGVRRDGATPGAGLWFDLILVPIARDLSHVLGLVTASLAGEEGRERESEFEVLGRLIRLFVDRHHQRARLREIFTLARQQQLSLLPPALPSFPGYRIAAFSLPAEEVGGDYYQTVALPHALFGFAVADAKGKGFEAAMQVTGLHAALRVVNEVPFKLGHKMSLVNRAMAQQTEFRNLISMFFGEMDPQGRLIYVNCSHPPPILVRSGGLEELEAGGRFLGLDPGAEYRFGVAELRAGDLIVAYTDGWTELFNDRGEEFGAARLRDLVRPLHGAEPEAVVAAIQAAADAFRSEAPFSDDRTLFVLRKD